MEGVYSIIKQRIKEFLQRAKKRWGFFVFALLALVPTSGFAQGIGFNLLNPTSIADSIWDTIIEGVSWFLLSITGTFMAMMGVFMDFAIEKTILQIGRMFVRSGDTQFSEVMDTVWSIVRDISNIAIIFILLFGAFAIILNVQRINSKRLIIGVVIAAIFINFSLFFTKAIIDVSNVVGLQFYNAIEVLEPGGESVVTENRISRAITSALGLNTVLKGGEFKGGALENSKFTVAIFGSIFFIVAGLVFMYTAFMLIKRFLALLAAMASSAFAFATLALPNNDMFKKWWKFLLHNAAYAPIFFFMLYLTIKVMTADIYSDISGSGTKDFAAAIKNINTDTGALLLHYILILALLVATAEVPRMLIGKSGSFTQRFAGKVTSWGNAKLRGGTRAVGRGAKRTAGAAARSTVGYAGLAAQKRIERAQGERYEQAKKEGKSEFRARLSASRGGLSTIARATAKAAGEGRYGAKDSIADRRKKSRDTRARLEYSGREAEVRNILEEYERNVQSGNPSTRTALQQELRATLSQMTSGQRLQMFKNDKSLLTNELLASSIGARDAKKLRDDKDDLTETEKNDFNKARLEAVKAHVTSIPPDQFGEDEIKKFKTLTKNLDKDDYEYVDASIVNNINFAQHVSDDGFEAIAKSNRFGDTTMETLSKNRVQFLVDAASQGVGEIRQAIQENKLTAEQLGKRLPLAKELLDMNEQTGQRVAATLSPGTLKALSSAKGISLTKMQEVMNAVENTAQQHVSTTEEVRNLTRLIDWLQSPAGQSLT